MANLGAASELDAICELLASIGEDPVEDIDNLPPSGNMARTVLHAVSRDFQEEGHWFNEETITLSPNVDGEILVGEAILDLDGVNTDVGVLDGKAWNRENRSFTFSAPEEFEVVIHREWDNLPSVARRLITALAIERFVEGFPGADATSASRQRNLMRAQDAFRRAEIRAGDYNLLDNSSIQTLARRS